MANKRARWMLVAAPLALVVLGVLYGWIMLITAGQVQQQPQPHLTINGILQSDLQRMITSAVRQELQTHGTSRVAGEPGEDRRSKTDGELAALQKQVERLKPLLGAALRAKPPLISEKVPVVVREEVDRVSHLLAPRYPKLSKMFRDCFVSTLETTTMLLDNGHTHVFTGKILHLNTVAFKETSQSLDD